MPGHSCGRISRSDTMVWPSEKVRFNSLHYCASYGLFCIDLIDVVLVVGGVMS